MKVFISYAREDYETAKRLYDDLKAAGITPWMDKRDILIGQNWKLAVREAIKNSSFFLALISSHSVSKKGFVQSELKMAIEILDELPQSDIFCLPIRLDECTPPHERFKDIHWGDLFPSYEKGLKDIVRVFESLQDAVMSKQHDGIISKTGGYELVRIPGGVFMLGSKGGRYDKESPQHQVEVPEFYMGRYPVTNEEYNRFLTKNRNVKELVSQKFSEKI